jgi:hypothetical protein
MHKPYCPVIVVAVAWVVFSFPVTGQRQPGIRQRNTVIVVFDGLRGGSVNATDAPTMFWIRTHGVSFPNSHSLFPTFTTANASAIATGHYLGDTGDYTNTIYVGRPVFSSGNFGQEPGSYAPYLENDPVLGDLNAQFGGNYLNEETLLSAARKHGFNTAVVGKAGPAAIQDVTQLTPINGQFAIPQTIIIDDGTGTPDGVPLNPAVSAALLRAELPTVAPKRDQSTGDNTTPGTMHPNKVQQAYFADAISKVILPMFKQSGKPFILLYWSRDPDGTQHFQGDSLNTLVPGINGPTSRAGLRNADDNLKQIWDYIQNDPLLAANTNVFITADHGFATISKHEIDTVGHFTASYAARWVYRDLQGRREVNAGFLPQGFLAIDLAHALRMPLYDPDNRTSGPDGGKVFERVDPTISQQQSNVRQHPSMGNGLIGGAGRVVDKTDAKAVVTANGGSDLIYLPDHDPILLRKIITFLAGQDYIGGLFVDDTYGRVPGALPMSSIGLVGSSRTPRPSIVVDFRSFYTDGNAPLTTAVQITDYYLQHGQGMHGSFARANTFNFMAAIGPDFKKQFIDQSPVSNADISPTLARLLAISPASNGELKGRVLQEALANAPSARSSRHRVVVARPAANGRTTVLMYQQIGRQKYFDQACFTAAIGKQQICP